MHSVSNASRDLAPLRDVSLRFRARRRLTHDFEQVARCPGIETDFSKEENMMNKISIVVAMVGAFCTPASGRIPARAGVVAFTWDPSQAVPAPKRCTHSVHRRQHPGEELHPHDQHQRPDRPETEFRRRPISVDYRLHARQLRGGCARTELHLWTLLSHYPCGLVSRSMASARRSGRTQYSTAKRGVGSRRQLRRW